MSCSYGPGRYDPSYEEKGNDYPFGFVRWTEQRNFEAVLDTLQEGRLDVQPLISHELSIDVAEQAYELIVSGEKSLGILLAYPLSEERGANLPSHRRIENSTETSGRYPAKTSFIGAGNYASSSLMPAFQSTGAKFRGVACLNGLSGTRAMGNFHFDYATTDANEIFKDSACDNVVITTRHDSHASLISDALNSGKHVFVEKPLCLTLEELDRIRNIKSTVGLSRVLMVGFNRRFSPHVQKIKELLHGVKSPKSFAMTINAGFIPGDHWIHTHDAGGGRLIGEACHFVDLLRYLADAEIASFGTVKTTDELGDTFIISLKFSDGSIGTINYFSNGPKAIPKERLEIFTDGRHLQLDNYRILKGVGWKRFSRMTLSRQDKGQKACAEAFIRAIQSGEPPISFEEISEVTEVCIRLASSSG